MPLVTRPGSPPAKIIRKACAELQAPLPDALIGDLYTALSQKQFDISEAQAEYMIQPRTVLREAGGATPPAYSPPPPLAFDVIMNEDQDRNRMDNSPYNLAILRHMAMNVMRKEGSQGSLRGKFKRAGWDDTFLRQLLAAF